MAGVNTETFFTQAHSPFPEPIENEKINANEFLSASTHLAHFFGFFKHAIWLIILHNWFFMLTCTGILGTVFTPVQSDISGNVKVY